MPSWVEAGVKDYLKRLPPHLAFNLVELPLPKRGKNADIKRLMQQESEAILQQIKTTDWVVALEVTGKTYSTEQLAQQLKHWQLERRDVKLLIGGPDGLHPDCLQRANQTWSLSPLTLPHPLVRVIVTEQIYRANSILSGHPYHR